MLPFLVMWRLELEVFFELNIYDIVVSCRTSSRKKLNNFQRIMIRFQILDGAKLDLKIYQFKISNIQCKITIINYNNYVFIISLCWNVVNDDLSTLIQRFSTTIFFQKNKMFNCSGFQKLNDLYTWQRKVRQVRFVLCFDSIENLNAGQLWKQKQHLAWNMSTSDSQLGNSQKTKVQFFV